MVIINDINDEKITLYRSLRKTPSSHTNQQIFVAEGDIAVKKLLDSNLDICSIFCTEDYFNIYKDQIYIRVKSANLYIGSKNLMDQIVGFRLHKGIMAIAKQPESTELSELRSPVIILNGIVNSENVGAIVRNCVAFGIKSLVVDKQTSSPYMRRAVRCSMGAVYFMDIHFSDDITKCIDDLKSKMFSVLAAENTEDAKLLNNYKFPEKYAIVLGSEGKGINPKILSLADQIIKIPISDNIASINVAACSAIFFEKMSIKK